MAAEQATQLEEELALANQEVVSRASNKAPAVSLLWLVMIYQEMSQILYG